MLRAKSTLLVLAWTAGLSWSEGRSDVTDIFVNSTTNYLECVNGESLDCFWTRGSATYRRQDKSDDFNFPYLKKCSISLSKYYRNNGIWTCVYPDSYKTTSYRVTVVVQPTDPVIHYNGKPLSEKMVLVNPNANGEITLQCLIKNGVPGPEAMIWTVDGVDESLASKMEVSMYDDGRYVDAKSTLVLKFHYDANTQDQKNVSCRVRHVGYAHSPDNENGTVTYQVVAGGVYPTNHVEVTTPDQAPFISEEFGVQRSVRLNCEANGIPMPTEFTFYNLTADNRTEMFGVSNRQTVDVYKPGNYLCEAANKLPDGTYTRKPSVPIKVHPSIDPQHSRTVVKDSGIILACELQSSKDECIWTHEGSTYFSGRPKQDPDYTVEKSEGNGCNLVLQRVKDQDAGYWQCVSKNGLRHTLVYLLKVRAD